MNHLSERLIPLVRYPPMNAHRRLMPDIRIDDTTLAAMTLQRSVDAVPPFVNTREPIEPDSAWLVDQTRCCTISSQTAASPALTTLRPPLTNRRPAAPVAW